MGPNDFLHSLPNHLRIKVEKQIAQRDIGRIDFLNGLNDAIIGSVRISLTSIQCNAGHRVFCENDRSNDIYLVRVGCARLVFGKNDVNKEKSSRLLKRGDVVGEYCIVCPVRSSTLICETFCEFYTLKADSLKEIIFDHLNDETEAENAWQGVIDILENSKGTFRHIPRYESEKCLKLKAKNPS